MNVYRRVHTFLSRATSKSISRDSVRTFKEIWSQSRPGAHLARMELQAFFRELSPRPAWTELASPPEDIAATFVGGPKRVPIRYRIEPRD